MVAATHDKRSKRTFIFWGIVRAATASAVASATKLLDMSAVLAVDFSISGGVCSGLLLLPPLRWGDASLSDQGAG